MESVALTELIAGQNRNRHAAPQHPLESAKRPKTHWTVAVLAIKGRRAGRLLKNAYRKWVCGRSDTLPRSNDMAGDPQLIMTARVGAR